NVYAAWTGNSATGQQIVFTKFSLGFTVIASTPAAGQLLTTAPTDFVIQLNSPVAAGSVQASDLAVNGIQANSFALNGTGDTITFHYNVSPVTVEGPQSMAIGGGGPPPRSDPPPPPAPPAPRLLHPHPPA